jgi:DNA-binding transcriptional MocR family regulator
LRRELGLHYLSQGIGLAGDELLITCGGMEALTLAMRAAVSASGSQSMVVVTPAFPAALEQLRHLGIAILPAALSEQGSLDLSALEDMLREQRPAGIVLMANFQHPTGLLMPEAQKRAGGAGRAIPGVHHRGRHLSRVVLRHAGSHPAQGL